MKLIKASEKGNDKEAEKILREKINLEKESELLAEADELNKKSLLN
ncbi:MAG: hypothetical protein KW788_00740 [Candidatus Doudnabacteria bacterium]|nr:hypothetical protein [Candidatus Doudnabacteria bacterium]